MLLLHENVVKNWLLIILNNRSSNISKKKLFSSRNEQSSAGLVLTVTPMSNTKPQGCLADSYQIVMRLEPSPNHISSWESHRRRSWLLMLLSRGLSRLRHFISPPLPISMDISVPRAYTQISVWPLGNIVNIGTFRSLPLDFYSADDITRMIQCRCHSPLYDLDG